MVERRTDRWAAHPRGAAAVRIGVVLVPLGLSVLTAVAVGRMLPSGDSRAERLGWWLAVFAVSSLTLYLSDRLARRLLPLAVLLELSLVFPDRAPSRMRKLRTPSVRDLDARLARLRANGTTTPAIEVAETLVVLVGVLGLHDKRTRGHSERVRALVDLITDEMGLSEDDRGKARWVALVHDLGKLTVPVTVLNKPGGLDEHEWDIIRQHPEEGTRLAAGMLPWLGDWGRAIGEHHERWDGLGYPKGLAGEEISLGARIVSVADSFEVMTTHRSYGRARSASVARQELTACAGTQFDPAVVRTFLSLSLGRTRWVFGPLTWLAEIPLLALDRAGQAARLGTATAAVGGLAVAGVIAPPATAAPPSAPPGVAAGPAGAAPVASAPVGVAPSPVLLPSPASSAGASPDQASRPVATSTTATPRASASPSGPAPRPGVTAPAGASSAAPVRTTPYWFAGRARTYVLAPTEPTTPGEPPDADGDGQPGVTITRSTGEGGVAADNQRVALILPLDRPLRLSGVPSVVVWSQLASGKGNARVDITVEDCSSSGQCKVLSRGHVQDGTWSAGSFVPHDIRGTRIEATLPAGNQLRLTLGLTGAGSTSDLWTAVDSRSAPSRLDLPVV